MRIFFFFDFFSLLFTVICCNNSILLAIIYLWASKCSTTTIMSPFPVCLCLCLSLTVLCCFYCSVLFCSSNGFQSRSGSACSRLVRFIPTEICFWKTLTTERLCLYVLYMALPAAKPAATTTATTATTTAKATTIDSSGYRKYKYEYKHNYAGTVPIQRSRRLGQSTLRHGADEYLSRKFW